jgi:hypothetical protein
MGERERLITLNLVGIIAGIIILVTIFSPWTGVVYIAGLTTFSREFSSLDFFTGSFSSYLRGLLAIPPPNNPPPPIAGVIGLLLARVPVYTSLALVAVVLLIASAVITFFHGFIGGGIGLIGLLIYIVLGSDLYTGYNVIMPGNAFTVTIGAGFIVSWIAVALALISQLFRLKAPHLVSITIWRRGPITLGPPPPPEVTGVYEITMTRCPKCGAENSPSAKFCRNCGTSLTPETLPKPS